MSIFNSDFSLEEISSNLKDVKGEIYFIGILGSGMYPLARLLKKRGYNVVCADERTDNILGECALPLPILLIIGGEKRGISKEILDLANTLVRIDYGREFKASLSAASATTMFAYEIMRQNKIKNKNQRKHRF